MAEGLYAMGLGGEDSNPNVAKIAIEQRKKKTEVVEPQVISEDLLIEGVEEPVKPNPEEPWDPIDFPKVISMKLSFLNIIEIANLVNFDSLTTLRLDNNIIDKIVNLKSLKNLTWLDLSFNNIKEIENLDQLSNLTDLSLYHNQIEEIKGLDGCPNLNILSLGHNKIHELKQIDKLRPFQNLRCVCLEGNKVCSNDSYNQHVLAHLTNLKYLDYMLIDKKAVAQAMEAFQAHDELAEKVEEEAAAQAIENARKEKEALREKLRESFLDSTDDFFEELFSAEVESEHLKALASYQPYKEDYRDKLADEIRALKQGMEKPNEDRQRKAKAFEKAIYNAEKESEDEAFQMVRQFRSLKKQVLATLDKEENAPQKVDMMIQQLLEQLIALQNLLMGNEVQLQESIEEAIAEFESKVSEIVKLMGDRATQFFEKITEIEKNLDQCLKDNMAKELEDFASTQNATLDGDMENQNKAKYLQDRDEMGRQCGNLNEFHLNLIGSKEEKMTGDMTNWLKVFVKQHQERQYHRNRQRIMDVKKVIEECKEEINAAGDAAEFDDEHDNGQDAYVR
jgi:Leucine-rich repeat (LRR) protein